MIHDNKQDDLWGGGGYSCLPKLAWILAFSKCMVGGGGVETKKWGSSFYACVVLDY